MTLKTILLLLVLSAASFAQQTFEVSGEVVMPGNKPFLETIHFDFLIEYGNENTTGFLVRILPAPILSESGPLSPFLRIEGPFAVGSGNCGYIALVSLDSDEMQVNMCGVFSPAPSFYSAVLYACGTKQCVHDFVPPDFLPKKFMLPARNLNIFAQLSNVIVREIQ